MTDAKAAQAPEGFEPIQRGGPFLASLGALYLKRREGQTALVGLRVEAQHLNSRGVAHGGMLVALADTALGIALALSQAAQPFATVSLSADFADSARAGDFLEAEVEIQKIGTRLAFASCYLAVAGRRILRASGVFARAVPAAPRDPVER